MDNIFILELEADVALAKLRAAKSFRLYGTGTGQQPVRAYYRQARRHLRRVRVTKERLMNYKNGITFPCNTIVNYCY